MEKLSKADLEKEAILNPEKAEKRKQMRRRARLMAVITALCVFCGLYHRFYGSPGHGKKQHYE